MNFIYRMIGTMLLVLVVVSVRAQSGMIRGTVVTTAIDKNLRLGLPGAVVRLLPGDTAVLTDVGGNYSIPYIGTWPFQLVVSFVGYKTDTISVYSESAPDIQLVGSVELQEVSVTGKKEAVGYSRINPLNIERVGEKEILKAACCNLSEAFESSPTVNVAYTDAVTGAKEIRLLGLSGIYSQLLTEAIPNYRGIAGAYGLYFIPGPWMESIQVTKGTGSVQQGYEATTGQINVEFKKPNEESVPRFFLNLFGEQNGNMELNTHVKHEFNEHWSSILMAHGNYMNGNQDLQDDGFLDIPHAQQVNLYNRWHYNSGNRLESQFGWRYVYDLRKGGQFGVMNHSQGLYTTDVLNARAEAFGKLGIVFRDKPGKSIGNIAQATIHRLNARFGITTYNAQERTLLLQSLFENSFNNGQHHIKLGVNYRYDEWTELIDTIDQKTVESVPGAFVEYTYNHADDFSVVIGQRLDHHNTYGFIYTPRIHAKYNFSEEFILRASAGSSFRVPNIFADNLSMLASSRQIIVAPDILPERAWNFGFNATWHFMLNDKEGAINLDAYRSVFSSQLIVDRVTAYNEVLLYNLQGASYSNSGQVAVDYEVLDRLNVRLAYKRDDVKVAYNDSLQRKPLIPYDRSLLNLAYLTANEHWRFDYTIVREGRKRLLPTYVDPTFDSQATQSPVFITMNIQVTKVFRKFEAYVGSENLLNYYQEHPIVNADDPFGPSFDATNVWGPIDGRRIYAGIRYAIK